MALIINNVYALILLASVPLIFGLSVNVLEFIIQGTNKQWNINQGSFEVRSLLECSTICSEMNNICGFNYLRSFDGQGSTVRDCQCLLLSDLNPLGSHDNITRSLVYIHELCTTMYTNLLISSTSTSSPTTTPTTITGPITTSVSTVMATSSTTTGMAIPSSTTSSTTSSTITAIPTTTTSTATTTLPPCSSTLDALMFIGGTIYLFIDNQIFTYSSYIELTTGASTTVTLSNLFPEVSHPIDAGYNDGTFVYFIKGTDTWKYSSNQLTYHSHVTTSTLYTTGGGDDSESDSSDSEDEGGASDSNYDAILQSDPQTYFFTGNSLTIVESGSILKTVSLSNNVNNNPYKSNNFDSRPTQIAAASAVDSDTHVFISHNSVYIFTFSTKLWNNLGQLVCIV